MAKNLKKLLADKVKKTKEVLEKVPKVSTLSPISIKGIQSKQKV